MAKQPRDRGEPGRYPCTDWQFQMKQVITFLFASLAFLPVASTIAGEPAIRNFTTADGRPFEGYVVSYKPGSETVTIFVKRELTVSSLSEADRKFLADQILEEQRATVTNSPIRLTEIANNQKFLAEIPWRKSKAENGYIAIFRRYNGSGGTNMVPVADTTSFNETNLQLSGPDASRVDSITVDVEIYNEKYVQDSLAIFLLMLKSVDQTAPIDDFAKVIVTAKDTPKPFGRWTLELKPNRAGYDIEANMNIPP